MKRGFTLLSASLLGLFVSCGKAPQGPQHAVWNKQAEGVWIASVGAPEKMNLLSELGLTPRLETIDAMGEAAFPLDETEIRFELRDGKTYIRFPLERDEQIFGLGLHFKTVQQRGRIMQLHMDHYGGTDNGRTHAPVPFFVSSRGYGALINTARYLDVWVGTGVRQDSGNPPEVRDRTTDPQWSANPYSDNLEFLVPAEGVEVILFAGKDMLDVVRRFNLYNGGGVLPPRWGLGLWHRVPTGFSAEQVTTEADEFARRGFPLDVVGLEPGWMSNAYPCSYEWDTVRFPDPAAFVRAMGERGIRTNLWINPYIYPGGVLAPQIGPYTGSHTVWCGLVPDYTMPEARRIITGHFEKYQLDIGVSGFKMDENDGYDEWLWPDVATFPSGTPAGVMRSLYGSLMQQATYEMFRKRDQRTYGLVRAGNAGVSSFPYVIYNDYYNHRDFITALINSSFIGVLWTPEVRQSHTAEEWVRRWQTVCFSPLAMLNAWASGAKPWSFPEVEKEVASVVRLRTQIIPYLYTAFADYAFFGTPPTRAMVLEPGFDHRIDEVRGALDDTENPYLQAVKREIKDQYMVGGNLLVAPVFAGQTERTVVLPRGKWYDFYTGELAGGGEVITVQASLDKIPVYVKDGGIVPMWPAETPAPLGENGKPVLEVRHYGQAPGTFDLYDDDGTTFAYQRGEFIRIALSVAVAPDGSKSGRAIVPDGAKVWSFGGYEFRFMTK